MDLLPIHRAILSVTDKTGLVEFAKFLVDNGVELVSTGGTMKCLKEGGLPVKAVSDVTGFPEILGGRVKTLHPMIHGGILCNKDLPEQLETVKKMGITPVDLVCVNLYNFAGAVSRHLSLEQAVEEIDIGGPACSAPRPRTIIPSSLYQVLNGMNLLWKTSKSTTCALPLNSGSSWLPAPSTPLPATTL